MSPSSAGGVGLIPGWGAKIHMPHGQRTKKKKKRGSTIVTDSIKTLKMVHIKKKSLKMLNNALL